MNRTALVIIVAAAALLAGCEDMSKAYSNYMCEQATANLGANALYGAMVGGIAWIACYRGAVSWALVWAALAGNLVGHGYSTNVTCGVGVYNVEAAAMGGAVAALPALFVLLIMGRDKSKAWGATRRERREQRLIAVATEKAAAEQKRMAELEKAEFLSMTATMDEQREVQAAEAARRHLLGHLDTIEAAIRAVKSGGDNTVLMNAIAQELGAISANARISAAMIADDVVVSRARTAQQVLRDKGTLDAMLALRFEQVFGALPLPSPAPRLAVVKSA